MRTKTGVVQMASLVFCCWLYSSSSLDKGKYVFFLKGFIITIVFGFQVYTSPLRQPRVFTANHLSNHQQQHRIYLRDASPHTTSGLHRFTSPSIAINTVTSKAHNPIKQPHQLQSPLLFFKEQFRGFKIFGS
ncbi:hypothetical protein M8C21_024398 [Ambrosia artemisiifolia]|uniref:Uncharacterized protein n=1 Tax=Ambrosia artemisiifolia TaxID=4212 RepID=A0AAD5C333_AMBAR|nr:hypothetical protein M8C21_024398 [Ambrosia artemisiifolia]